MKGWITLLPLALLAACASPRRVRTVPIERVTKDTVVVRYEQVDSIYVRQERTAERLHDTLLLSERTTEYRYRLLRDTVRLVQRDSIPYEVRIEQPTGRPAWLPSGPGLSGGALLLIGLLLAWARRR